MTTNLAADGQITDRLIDYYAERGRGGVGLIITEDAVIDSTTGRHTFHDMFVDHDKHLPGLRRLARTMKAEGVKAALQLSHAGSAAGRLIHGKAPIADGISPVAPSAIPASPGAIMPRELTIKEIQELEDKFAQAAVRAKDAGFDLISLHGAHDWLIRQFLSPATNHRQDIYGRDINGRLRFLLEIIRKTRELVGSDYPIMARINGEERREGGITVEYSREISRHLEAAGIECISVSVDSGVVASRLDIPPITAPMLYPYACMAYLAAAVKEVVSIPVMTANRIATPQIAEEILEQGKADLTGLGRAVIADPEWPRKAKQGQEDEIRQCIACQYCIHRIIVEHKELRCAINAAAGQEADYVITPASRSKTVFIAGGGPAGLEAARISALRGHKVHLFEKEKIGGQLNLACIPPGKAEVRLFLDFEERQLNQVGVKIKNKNLTPEVIMQEKPDAVIIATGAQPLVPSLPGINGKNVVTAWQVLNGETTTGNIVVILGGGQVGAETAKYLANEGRQVTIVEMLGEIAADMYESMRGLMLISLDKLGVKVRTDTIAKAISDNGVTVDCNGKEELINADTVVLALGASANRELVGKLEKLVSELYMAGDCVEARKLPDAIEDGFKAASKI